MSVEPDPKQPAPAAKKAMPPLKVRAERPAVVRVRKGFFVVAGLASAGVCAGALAWAFIIQPDLRAHAREERAQAMEESQRQVRPNQQIREGPATYGDIAQVSAASRAALQEPSEPAEPPQAHSAPPPTRRARAGNIASQAEGSGLFFKAPPGARGAEPSLEEGKPGEVASADYSGVYNPHTLLAPRSPYELKAGSVIPAVLLTSLDSARAGPVTASVSESVYDTVSGRHLIIPQGSRLIGRHEGESRHGDKRVFLIWDRLILPNGKSLVLSQEPGVDAQGAIGVQGQVERRLLPLTVATLFAGAITALGEIARDGADQSRSWLGDAGDAAAIQAAQVGGRLIDREIDVRPSISVRPGARVRVLVTRDLILEPYQ